MPRLADIAIVIPVGPGDDAWRGLLPLLDPLPSATEVVLSMVAGDRQSTDSSDHAVWLIHGPAGRARQQNAGAAATTRPWLWFLHADSRFGPDALQAISAHGDAPMLGFFDLRFHDGGWPMQLNAFGCRLRSRLLGLPFGDQGLLLPRVEFDRLGGFDACLDAGEDHALVWAARRAGLRLQPLRAALSTSARKYRERGWLRTTAQHLWLTCRQARRFARLSS